MIKEVANLQNGDLVLRRRHKPSGTTARLGIIVQDRYRKQVYMVQWVDCMMTSDLVTHDQMVNDFTHIPSVNIVHEFEEFNLDQE